jgi:hypothetical protein
MHGTLAAEFESLANRLTPRQRVANARAMAHRSCWRGRDCGPTPRRAETLKRRQKGSGKTKTQKRRFRTDWREPKQIIVFEMDEHGRMKKGTKPILDGTFQGPDEILEALAMRLHQVGASQAKVVAFRAA